MRIWSVRSASIIEPRVSRAKTASCGKASAIIGRMRKRSDPSPQPPAGSQESMMAKISVSTGPTTKFGTVTPMVATDMTEKSRRLFCRSAAMVPTMTPPTSASSSA